MEEIKEVENSLLDKQVAPEKPKGGKKMKIAFVAILFLVLGALLGNNFYGWWQRVGVWKLYDDELKRAAAELKVKEMADTYGGETPYETLNLYIEAVKKGDYALASKYFIFKYQERELHSYDGTSKVDIDKYLGLLEGASKTTGGYSTDKNGFTIDKPILVNFVKYPNGIWKIIEI